MEAGKAKSSNLVAEAINGGHVFPMP